MVLAWPHPADHQPADWTLSMSEVTAYGAAWRRGDSWLLPPNPIPIDYVTRAAFLWRGGECYRFDDRANPPLCWVSCGGSRGLSPAAAPAGPVAQRLLPVVFLPGEPLTVAIDIQPSEGTGAYAVEDAIPPGWAITAISNDGEYDGASGRVKWGPFFDSLPRTLSYQVTPPRTTSDPASFTGVSSFDGVSVPIAGQRELGEGCRLHVGTQPISGQFELTFAGRAGANFVLETSSDLISWTPWTTVSNAHGGLRFFTLIQPDTPRCFFRARLLR